MNCNDFHAFWNTWLDTRSGVLPEYGPDLLAHATSCDSCAAIHAGYRAIGITPWPQPVASPASESRLIAVLDRETSQAPASRPIRLATQWAAAAAAIVGLVLARGWLVTLLHDEPAPAVDVAVPSAPLETPFVVAFSRATSASIDLAREATEPAARVSRHVFDSASRSTATSSSRLESLPARDLLQTVGQKVEQGVRPLSISARRAFGFLLVPSPSV